jgi:3-deoxy-7-phosphoheptulonate synthase
MIVIMDPEAAADSVEQVIRFLTDAGLTVNQSTGQACSILGVVGEVSQDHVALVRELSGVAKVVRVSEPYRLASRRFRREPTIVEGPWGIIGGERPWIAIEPVGLEWRGDLDRPSKPPTDLPYEVRAGRPFDAVVFRSRTVPEAVGALAALSLHAQPMGQRRPITFVERQPSRGTDHWIGAAERELERREGSVVLLEAGDESPNGVRTLEIGLIARAKVRTHLPVVVDVPSIAQRARYCTSVAAAAVAAGADGVVLRVWVGPEASAPLVPATLRWQEAMQLAEKLLAVGAALRS